MMMLELQTDEKTDERGAKMPKLGFLPGAKHAQGGSYVRINTSCACKNKSAHTGLNLCMQE